MQDMFESQPRIRPIPQQRVIEKMDEYMDRRDYPGAERHLLYWLEEARAGGDLRGQLLVRNELIGHYRKTGQRDEALANIDAAMALLRQMDFDGTISAGTTFVNAATALNAFGENERALALFERARPLYERSAATRPALLGGLYNNMALTCAALGRYDEALELYDRAMAQMALAPNGELEQAVTCLNRADALAQRDGTEAAEQPIFALVEQAVALLDTPSLPRDGYYAFVCEKCAPSLEYYGWFDDARRLTEEAERIYAGA